MPTDDRSVHSDDRFDELATRLGGFYLSWVVYLGLELGLFARIRAAGAAGIAPATLASETGCAAGPVEAWVRAAHSSELVGFDGERVTLPDDTASVLLDDTRPEYLGGQFVAAVVSSLDYAALADFFRSGRPIPERPPRFHRAIEAVTVQDIAVFFQEGLAQLPELAASLAAGGRVLDVACGGGKWLIAVAQRFPATSLVGVEFEPDSVARAMRHVTDAGLESRGSGSRPATPWRCRSTRSSTSSTSRTRSTSLPDPAGLAALGVEGRPPRRPPRRPRLVPAIVARGLPVAPGRAALGRSRSTSCSRARRCTRARASSGSSARRRCRSRRSSSSCRGRRSSWSSAPPDGARRSPGSGYSVTSIVKSFIWVGVDVAVVGVRSRLVEDEQSGRALRDVAPCCTSRRRAWPCAARCRRSSSRRRRRPWR